VGIEN